MRAGAYAHLPFPLRSARRCVPSLTLTPNSQPPILMPSINLQDVSIAALERAGYVFVCWFSACDPENPDAQCATMELRHRRMSHSHITCEVDPNGSVNGQTLNDYLASVRKP